MPELKPEVAIVPFISEPLAQIIAYDGATQRSLEGSGPYRSPGEQQAAPAPCLRSHVDDQVVDLDHLLLLKSPVKVLVDSHGFAECVLLSGTPGAVELSMGYNYREVKVNGKTVNHALQLAREEIEKRVADNERKALQEKEKIVAVLGARRDH
jgi:hypothetical protein